jgi:hypothetical protein
MLKNVANPNLSICVNIVGPGDFATVANNVSSVARRQPSIQEAARVASVHSNC